MVLLHSSSQQRGRGRLEVGEVLRSSCSVRSSRARGWGDGGWGTPPRGVLSCVPSSPTRRPRPSGRPGRPSSLCLGVPGGVHSSRRQGRRQVIGKKQGCRSRRSAHPVPPTPAAGVSERPWVHTARPWPGSGSLGREPQNWESLAPCVGRSLCFLWCLRASPLSVCLHVSWNRGTSRQLQLGWD